MHNVISFLGPSDFPVIFRRKLESLQINITLKCNQACLHCHVNASPKRTEFMSEAIIETVLQFISKNSIQSLDITGGAPELHPAFKYIVDEASKLGVHIIDRCNLTVLLEQGYEYLPDYLAERGVEIVASLPCYQEQNVDAQRGAGVFQKSIQSLKILNQVGYGVEGSGLSLNLVYNPQGPALPPEQSSLEKHYKKELGARYGIHFNKLLVLCNMPINRFGSTLISNGEFQEYIQTLKNAYREKNLEEVMCRSMLSVDWQGYLYDCDFNQMLELGIKNDNGEPLHINDIMLGHDIADQILVRDHCYGCTAGQGSSCGGALS